MFQITSQGEGSGPTLVTCPVCDKKMSRAEQMANMHGTCCSADCAAVYAMPLRQRELFQGGEAPYRVEGAYEPILLPERDPGPIPAGADFQREFSFV